jgi:hypothetical protein
MRIVVVAVVVVGCRGGGVFIPPAQVTSGAAVPITRAAAVRGASDEVLVGLHWASLAWKPTRFDIGIGYVGSWRPIAPAFATVARDASGNAATPPPPSNQLDLEGGYLELAYAFHRQRHWRSWVSWRGELLSASANASQFTALGSAVRVATELYINGVIGGHGGIIAGALALGAYAEVQGRELPSELGPVAVAGGFVLRVPFVAIGGK